MHSILTVPLELQMQVHQQTLFRQEQIALRRHRPEEMHNLGGWPIGSPPLPSDVKVELQNQQLWHEFHAHTTEMIITKSGRRMFPSIQLGINGLERRARYCVLLEITPASDRRHKYVGSCNGTSSADVTGPNRGWTFVGPAEPQPRFDRRIYLHPDSPAPGAHWMQHPVSFSKLKLTNNDVDSRNNVVLTSMHKYIPRIWIIRCDDLSRITDFYSHPASSFTFKETEFIAVTAYQNESITKLKIDNNPFAKGFRKTGQSRSKRKFQELEGDRSNQIDEDEGASSVSSLETDSTRSAGSHLDIPPQRPKTASSETGSTDDSGVSSCGAVSPPLLLPVVENSPSKAEEADRETQPRLHRPWIDSPSSCSNTVANLSNPPIGPHDFRFSPYYFGLLQPRRDINFGSQFPFIRHFSKYN